MSSYKSPSAYHFARGFRHAYKREDKSTMRSKNGPVVVLTPADPEKLAAYRRQLEMQS